MCGCAGILSSPTLCAAEGCAAHDFPGQGQQRQIFLPLRHWAFTRGARGSRDYLVLVQMWKMLLSSLKTTWEILFIFKAFVLLDGGVLFYFCSNAPSEECRSKCVCVCFCRGKRKGDRDKKKNRKVCRKAEFGGASGCSWQCPAVLITLCWSLCPAGWKYPFTHRLSKG